MINKTFAISKEKLDSMSMSEKACYLDRMVQELEGVEMVTFIVIGQFKEDFGIEEVKLNLIVE